MVATIELSNEIFHFISGEAFSKCESTKFGNISTGCYVCDSAKVRNGRVQPLYNAYLGP